MTKEILTALLVNTTIFSLLFGLMLPLRGLISRRGTAVLQYALWAVVVIKLMLPFGFESSLSPLQFIHTADMPTAVTIPDVTDAQVSPAGFSDGSISPMDSADVQTGAHTAAQYPHPQSLGQQDKESAPAAVASVTTTLTWMDWALIAWAVGAIVSAGFLAISVLRLRRRIRGEMAKPSERVLRIIEECKKELGLLRNVHVLKQSALGVPAAAGFLRPVLLLPEDIETRSDTQLRHICLHELMHVRHGDLAVITLLNVLCVFYWFNPLTWLCCSLIRKDMEAVCDASVLKYIGNEARQEYIGTVLHFASCEKNQRLQAAMGMADVRVSMEKRIYSMFRRTRTGHAAKTLALCIAALMLAVSLLTACQPTPEKAVVAGKNNGVLESALAAAPSAEATPYNVQDHLKLDVDVPVENYSIVLDADVIVPDQTAYPVYSVEMTPFTQEQADAVRLALLDGVTLYKPSEMHTRAEVQYNIDYYEQELKASAEYPELIDSYTEILKELYAEYEKAPEDLTLDEADTTLKFHEGQADGIMVDSNPSIVWLNDEDKKKVITEGGSSVYGVCWQKSGRKMEFAVLNAEGSSNIFFGMAEGNLVQNPGATCTLEEAIEQGNALLTAAGLDFSLVNAQPENLGLSGKDCDYYALSYKRNVPGVPLDYIQSAIPQNLEESADEEAYSGRVPDQEIITINIDDYGVLKFSWSQPLKVTATESENVPLIPFDEIESRISSQLKIQTMWDKDADADEEEWIESRRLEVNKIALSYLVVAKSDNMSSFNLIPVWNVCGDMHYHYKDSYPKGQSNTYVLDENNERTASRQYRYDTAGHSMLTINAIDGTVIPREMHT